MNWVWKRLAPFVRTTTEVEITGISEEQLRDSLNQEALRRLSQIEAVIFSEELDSEEKVQTIQDSFLADQ